MNYLKLARAAKGISQSKLAEAIGVSRSTIAMWETDGSQPDNASLVALSNYFGVSTDYLLGNENRVKLTTDNRDEHDRGIFDNNGFYNSSNVAERIKSFAKQQNISINKLLSSVGLGANTMSNMKTSMPKSENLAKIADYLDCSVDYLLGRDELPQKKASTSFDELAHGIIGDDADMAKAYNLLTSLSPENLSSVLKYIDYLVSQQKIGGFHV